MITISSNMEEIVKKTAERLYNLIYDKNKVLDKQILIYKPVPAPISKINNKYRWRIIMKCKFDNIMIRVINETLDEFNKNKIKNTRITVDVNPSSMM